MGYAISKVNTSLKIANNKTGYLVLTNMPVFMRKLEAGKFELATSVANISLHLTLSLAEIDSIAGAAPAGTVDLVFNQIAPLLN